MKKLIILSFCLFCSVTLFAQSKGSIVVDSEKIFKSVAKYNEAISSLDELAEEYQAKVDSEYESIEKMYNEYMAQKSYLSDSARNIREAAIINKEKEVAELQESLFGSEGTLIKTRVELIKPIQEAIFAIIKTYATDNGYDVVVDSSNNATLLYVGPESDKTEEIIQIINQ